MSSLNDGRAGRKYWRSLDDLAQAPDVVELLEREFPGGTWSSLGPATRRDFLRVMAASLGLAGLAGCRWPADEIVPFASRPEGRVPGVPQRFATAFELAGVALGMLVTSYDGRPVKAEGNPNHPDSLGGLPAVAQASVLELYDPDRSRGVVRRGDGQETASSWDDWDAFARDHWAGLRTRGGRGLAVLADPSSSPSLAALRGRLLAELPEVRWYEWAPLSRDNEREGTRLAFGRPLRVHPHLDRCKVVVCLDADPLCEHPAAVRMARDFASGHRPETGMSRLWVAEPGVTLTGVAADERLPVALAAVRSLLAELGRLLAGQGVALPPGLGAMLDRVPLGVVPGDLFTRGLAGDLTAHRGQGLILVGPRQPPEVHSLAHALNHALGNGGQTVTFTEETDPDRLAHHAATTELAQRIGAEEVDTLLLLGANPVLTAPADLGFAALLARVPTSIHLGLYRDESGRRSTWHLPQAHFLESWGDGEGWDGTYTPVQPLVEPLHGGRSAVELLAALVGGATPARGYEIVRATVAARFRGEDLERTWRQALCDGLVAGSARPEVRPVLDQARLAQALPLLGEPGPQPTSDRLELVFSADPKVHDGRFANNAWLQELPEPLTRVTWDNALLISPPTAHRLGLADGEVVAVEASGARVELPLYLLPGQASFSVTVALGYGRTAAGRVGDGVGVDLYPLRRADGLHATRVTLRTTGRRRRLATTQDHHAIDAIGFAARNQRVGQLVREATLAEYEREPEVIQHQGHHPPLVQLWRARAYEGEQWGMAVDLHACIGCGACAVACQAENNVPVVGREQVLRQREMHWLRVDRYFRSEPGKRPEEVERAEVVFQPVACVQCENAPCEQVCPVAATMHTRDGLNAMAYNRCVGTRYCSNNCPYKVRRFNFFNYRKRLDPLPALQLNPEVTVRSRGVMEKCTYCVQRIEAARIAARNENRPIREVEVVPACAQTCPTRAITFGNLNDPESAVARLRESPRAYALLAELNVRPRTLYLARLRNPVAEGGRGQVPAV